MTLAERLLPKLSEWRPAGAGRHSWSETDAEAGWTVRVAADRADSLSCLVWELSLSRSGDAPAGLALAKWADAIVARVGGLLEDLKVYEVDNTRNQAILRSDVPSARGDALGYYEIQLYGLSRAVVRRFTKSKSGGHRSQVAFALTHEVLAGLAGDIAG